MQNKRTKNHTKKQLIARKVSPKTAAIGIVATLLMLHIGSVLADLYLADFWGQYVTAWFDMDRERNVPTAASSLLLLAASGWAFRLAAVTRTHLQKVGWGLFGTLFGYFAFDEFFIIHEQLAEPLRNALGIVSGSPFYHAWVIPGIAISILIGTMGIIIKGPYLQLAVFSKILMVLFIFTLAIIACEIAGTYVYGNEKLYRLVMIPLEETTELSFAAYFWLHFRNICLRKRQASE